MVLTVIIRYIIMNEHRNINLIKSRLENATIH